jgi:hypothetical protein
MLLEMVFSMVRSFFDGSFDAGALVVTVEMCFVGVFGTAENAEETLFWMNCCWTFW